MANAMGWHLPGLPGRRAGRSAPCPTRTAPAGHHVVPHDVRSRACPSGHDASLGLTIGDPAKPRSAGSYRVLIFVNGWNMGQFIGHVGPQRTFVLPTGILNPNGRNTLALAVTSDGGPATCWRRSS